MGLVKSLLSFDKKAFTPSSTWVDWQYVQTLVHGPGTPPWGRKTDGINSAVFACLMAIASSYPEPDLSVYRRVSPNRPEKVEDHPLQLLLDMPTPNGELNMDELLFWTAWAKHVDGNAYWIKVRSGDPVAGNVVQLWPVSPMLMEPVTLFDDDGRPSDWISHYRMQVAPNEWEDVPIQNVIHFRLGIDDNDMRKGLSPLKALVRVIATDEEADLFVETLLKNYAVPGLVVIPPAGLHVKEDDADRLSERLARRFSQNQRGKVAVMSRDVKIEQFGFSPEQLDMSILHRIPEERISAVLGVPAIVAGLGAGLDRATYSNFKEAREMFTEQKLIPLWRADAKKIDVGLRAEFTPDRKIFVSFDLTDVRALQEDEDKKYARLSQATGKPFLTRNEARSDTGFDEIAGWDEEDTTPPPAPEPVLIPTNDGMLASEDRDKEMGQLLKRALRQFRDYGNASMVIKMNSMSPSRIGALEGALSAAKTEAQIRAAFNDVWDEYP